MDAGRIDGGKLFAGGDTVFAAAGDEDFFGGTAEDTVERELSLRGAAQFKQQFATIIGQRIHSVDETHARDLVEVRAVGDVLKKDERVAVEVGLSNESDEFRSARGPSVRAESTMVAPEP